MKKKSKILILLSIQIMMSFILSNCCKKESESDPVNVIDVKGNTYNVIRIGKQLWMKENLKTTEFNDGTIVPVVSDSSIWKKLSTPACCWYNNYSTANKSIYGALYNWYSVSTGLLCPTGWHVPSDAEWTELITYLGGENNAGGKLYPWHQQKEIQKKLDIVAISFDDSDTEVQAWQQKVKELNGWIHLRASEGLRSKVANDYYILGVPVMILLNAKTKEIIALPENEKQLIRFLYD
jgi:Fibrobacter succinogenes major domain (Fib_succ_major).